MAAAEADGGCRSLVAISIKCINNNTQKCIKSISHISSIKDIYAFVHQEPMCLNGFHAKCSTKLQDPIWYDVGERMNIGDLMHFGEIKSLNFECHANTIVIHESPSTSKATPNVLNAFTILMSGEKMPMKKKTKCHTRKDELYNNLVDHLNEIGLKINRTALEDEGSYIIQVLTNALWYVTNQHITINDIAHKKPNVLPVPEVFLKFQGYNEVKRKKIKSQPLEQAQLHSHSETLFSLIQRPIFDSDKKWCTLKAEIENLASCFSSYKEYLERQLIKQKTNQMMDHPPRTVGADISVVHRPKVLFVKQVYMVFDNLVSESPLGKPILFDESKHLVKPFENSMQRNRSFKDMALSSPIDLYKYCPGGSAITIVFVSKVSENRSEAQALSDPLRTVCQVEYKLPEFHTRSQKRYFKNKIKNLACIKPAVIDFMYKELAMDASQANHPETYERLRLISLGETGLVADLRDLNAGRPSTKFDVFFEKLIETVESVTATDERRHGEAHLSQWISLDEMISQAVVKCPENTLIPSKSLVRLQFAPRNPYTHAAINFTGKLAVQYKVQRRQLRASHPDQHFCAALFKYLKHKSVELGNNGILLCSDDKAKVPVGNPGLPISTGVRGKKTITPTSSTLVAADHDMNVSSLTPSVYLECKTPDNVEQSFVSGQVHVVVNESVFQPSNAMRHVVLMSKILKQMPVMPKVLLRFSDGGTDQRNTLEAVKCACICLFQELGLDMIIMARCAPGNSWVNPAERLMSILNLGLQNCALERVDETNDFKTSNSMSQVRQLVEKKPELKKKWIESVEPVQILVENRFRRLKLKDKPFQIHPSATDEEIDTIQRHLRELFPALALDKLQKKHTQKVESYQKWLDDHCRQRQYLFQIRKCSNSDCCIAPTTPTELLEWLPDPVFSDQSHTHYQPYCNIIGTDTVDHDRPSYSPPESKDNSSKGNIKRKTPNVPKNKADETNASLLTAQNARFLIQCIELVVKRFKKIRFDFDFL